MSEATQIEVEAETPVNPYSLLEAVNRSSDAAHMAWLIFLGIMAYLLIAAAGVTHKDLLLATPVQLPILGVEIQQVQFFQFAPILLVLFHLGLVSQLVLLARKTLEFDIAVRQLEPSRRRNHPLRLELHNFFFVQGIAGPHRSLIMGMFLHGMSWLTLVIIPVVLLLFIQFSFLPYHSIPITWTHRIALVLDIVVLALLGVFLSRAETNFFQAFWRAMLTHPVSTVITAGVIVAVLFTSFVIATIPGERLDTSLRRYFDSDKANVTSSSSYLPTDPFSFLFGSKDGTLFGLFHRNLIVTDLDLVVDREVSPGEPSISLRGRDLRFARLDRSDLHQADLTGVNLDGASLVGTNLSDARIICSDENQLIINYDRAKAKCASARRANFKSARMNGAIMNGIDLRNADFAEAQLEGVSLKFSLLGGANFSSANLQKADLSGGVKAPGTVFLIAQLEGADLNGAHLQFADFSSAFMQSARLEHAHLQAANLRDADLNGASMRRVRLYGADLTGANLEAADLRQAFVWMTLAPSVERLKLADLRGVEMRQLSTNERSSLHRTIRRIQDPALRKRVGESLAGVMDLVQSGKWETSNQAQVWYSLLSIGQPGVVADYKSELTTHLEQLACKSRWSNGAVAQGVAARAVRRRFAGDLTSIYMRLVQVTECEGGKNISPLILRSLETAVERNTERVLSAPAVPATPNADRANAN